MKRYSVQPRGWIIVKGYGFFCFAKNMGKNIVKIQVKTWVINTAKNFLIIPNNLLPMHLKVYEKEQFKK